MFLKQDNELSYKLFVELNNTFIHHFVSVFDKYIFSSTNNKNDFVKNEINTDTMLFNIAELLGSNEDSIFKKTLNELEFGNKIFKLLYIKLIYVYDYVLQLLYNEDVVINTDWEDVINQRYDEMSDKMIDKNVNFIERLRSSFTNMDFLFQQFTDEEGYDKEYTRMEGNLLTNTIEYNYTLETIFRMEISIMDQIFLTAKEYYIMIQKSKTNVFPDRSFVHYNDFDYKSFNKPKHNTGNLYLKSDSGYHVNQKLLLETIQYKFINQIKAYYNLVFLPFIIRLNYAIKNTTTDNNTTPYEFEHNHIFSPYATKSLYKQSFNIKRNNSYKDIESLYSSSIKKKGYNENEIRDCYLYRQKLSLMSFLLYHVYSFHTLSFSILDRIKESTEKGSTMIIDDPNPFTMTQIKIMVANSYYGSTLKIRQDYYDNEDKYYPTSNISGEIIRYNRILKTMNNEMIGKKNYGPRNRFQFFLLNMKIHDYIKLVLKDEMTNEMIDMIIDNLNEDVVKKLIGNQEIVSKDLKYPERIDFVSFMNNITNGNIVYEQSLDNVVIYNIILLIKILSHVTSKFHTIKKMFYNTLTQEDVLFTDYKKFIYYANLPFYLKTILPEEEKIQVELQPPAEFLIK